MNAAIRAERLIQEAKKLGLVNPITGDGMPTQSMITDALDAAYSTGQAHTDTFQLKNERNEIARLQTLLNEQAKVVRELSERAAESKKVIAQLERFAGAAKSCILCAEGWTNTMQREYNAAMRQEPK